MKEPTGVAKLMTRAIKPANHKRFSRDSQTAIQWHVRKALGSSAFATGLQLK